jgi:hypothetical protein
MLSDFIDINRVELIERCRAKVATRSDARRADATIDQGVPVFLDQLVNELRGGPSAVTQITSAAAQHGSDLLARGYTVCEVVHDYGDVCQAVTDLAVEQNAAIGTDEFRTLNRCLDDAIAGAVTEYGQQREQESARDAASTGARRDTVTRALLLSIEIAIETFEVVRSGKVGAAGRTGAVLTLGLDTAHGLAKQLLVKTAVPAPTPDAGSH